MYVHGLVVCMGQYKFINAVFPLFHSRCPVRVSSKFKKFKNPVLTFTLWDQSIHRTVFKTYFVFLHGSIQTRVIMSGNAVAMLCPFKKFALLPDLSEF